MSVWAFFEELPEAGLCFDVAQPWSIDKSMGEGHRILDAFMGKLRHIHLSSLDEDSHTFRCAATMRNFSQRS